jgi:hypothetical protein
MKKFFVTIILSAATTVLLAQKARLNAYGMYVFDDKFDSYYDQYHYYNGTLKGSFQYGLGAEFMVSPHNCIELMWQHQGTTAPTEYIDIGGITSNLKQTTFDVNIDYALIGGDRHFAPPNSKVEGYGGIFLGMAFLGAKNPENSNHNTASKFAWGLRLGCNVWANEKFGIKLQTQLLSISQGSGGGLYFGTGGVGAGVSSYSSVYQFQLGGGLTFKLGH